MVAVIPAYKPGEQLLDVVSGLIASTEYKIIVVNDGSGVEFDSTFSKLPAQIILLTHNVNCGKGRALKTAFEYILKNFPGENVVTIDADGQHLLQDIIKVCNRSAELPNALILGSRAFSGDVPLRSRFGNSLTRYVFAAASGKMLHDTQTGLRVIPASMLKEFCLLSGERYEYEMTMLLHASERGYAIDEVIIETVYIDDNSSSHFNVLRDSFKIYSIILKFACSSFIGFVVDYVLFLALSKLTEDAMVAATSLLVSTVLARVVSSIVNFSINRKVVFKSNEKLSVTLTKYYGLALIILVANYGIIYLLNIIAGINRPVAKIFTEVILYIFSYIVQRTFVFKPKNN